jgi:hypothetical protein
MSGHFPTGVSIVDDEITLPMSLLAHVRFGSKADIWTCVTDVRFTPISRHQITPAERPHTPLVHLSPDALEV